VPATIIQPQRGTLYGLLNISITSIINTGSINSLQYNSAPAAVVDETMSARKYVKNRVEWGDLAASGTYCKRKLDLLRIFSMRTDQLSLAAVQYATLAGNTTDLVALTQKSQAYEEENTETQAAYHSYSSHCREHGC
jgi:hypothetical protein